jgi:hypothetical protein
MHIRSIFQAGESSDDHVRSAFQASESARTFKSAFEASSKHFTENLARREQIRKDEKNDEILVFRRVHRLPISDRSIHRSIHSSTSTSGSTSIISTFAVAGLGANDNFPIRTKVTSVKKAMRKAEKKLAEAEDLYLQNHARILVWRLHIRDEDLPTSQFVESDNTIPLWTEREAEDLLPFPHYGLLPHHIPDLLPQTASKRFNPFQPDPPWRRYSDPNLRLSYGGKAQVVYPSASVG